MLSKPLVKYIPLLAALLLPLALLTSGLAAAQTRVATEGGENKPEASPASYYSDQSETTGALPPDDNPQYKAPNQPAAIFSYYMVSGPELHPRSTANAQSYGSNGCIYMSGGTSTGLLTGAGLHLPDDAVIKYIRLYYYDTNNTGGVDAFLTRYAPGSSASDRVSVGSTAAFNGGSGFVVSSEITETVNNAAYAYQLYGWPDAASNTLQVCGIRVAYYAPPQSIFGMALPLVIK